MKFSIKKSILLENLLYVIKAISPKNIIPVLNGIKFDLTKQGLELTASDSELVVRTIILTKDIEKVENCGQAIIQSKYIIDIIRKMPEEIINIEIIDEFKILIYTKNSKYNLNCLNYNDYPSIQLEESNNPIIIKGDILKQIITQTAFAVSQQESRPLLTGVNFKINGNIFECIVTDSYRLAKKIIKLDKNIEESINIVIPGKTLLEFDKIIIDNENVEMHIFTNKIILKYKNIIFKSNLLNGTYPDTSNLIPTEFDIIIKANRSEFYDAVDRAALLTQNKDKNTIKMSTNKNDLLVTSLSTELGKVEENIIVDKNSENEIEISFSSKYMLEALRTMEEEKIFILLNSDVKPIIVKSMKDETLIQLILPIKTY